jgi:hypothetical protein
MTKSAPRKVAARKARNSNPKSTSKVGKSHKKLTTEMLRNTHRKTDSQFDKQLRGAQVPDTLRALAERNVAQTREQYERSKNTLKAVLESWQKSFGAAGEGAVALNRKIVDITERNINTGFDLATGLVRAKNLADVVELHAAYWRKLLGGLQTQAEEGRAASSRTRARD